MLSYPLLTPFTRRAEIWVITSFVAFDSPQHPCYTASRWTQYRGVSTYIGQPALAFFVRGPARVLVSPTLSVQKEYVL